MVWLRKWAQQAWRCTLHAAGTVCVVSSVSMCLLIIGATLTNHQLYYVVSDSMVPAFTRGAMLIGDRDTSDVKEGDVVTYEANWMGGKIVSHRIVGHSGTGYTIKGDANMSIDDEDVQPEQLRSKVIAQVPLLGNLINKSWLLGVILLVGFLLRWIANKPLTTEVEDIAVEPVTVYDSEGGDAVSNSNKLLALLQEEIRVREPRQSVDLTPLFQDAITQTMIDIKNGADVDDFSPLTIINFIILAAQKGHSPQIIKDFVDQLSTDVDSEGDGGDRGTRVTTRVPAPGTHYLPPTEDFSIVGPRVSESGADR